MKHCSQGLSKNGKNIPDPVGDPEYILNNRFLYHFWYIAKMSPKPSYALFRNVANRQTKKDDNNLGGGDNGIIVDF